MMRELFLRDLSLWDCLWQSTAFAALGLIAGWLLRRHPARAYHVLLLAMTTAVAIPLLSAVVKHFDLGAFVAKRPELSYALPEIALAVPATAPDAGATQPAPPKPMPAGVVESAALRIPWQMILRCGWLAVTLALLGRLIATFLYGVRLVRHASRVRREDVQRAVDEARSKLAIPQELQVRASGRIRSPLVWCWSRPSILLVPDPCDDSQADWAGVVAHELAHCKRRDHVTGLIAEIMVSLLPWNPLIWVSRRFLIRLGEQACDDWVVASGRPSEDYAESLLRFRPQRQPAFWPAVVSSQSGLAHRVRRILNDTCANPRVGLEWTLMLSIVATGFGLGVAFAQTRAVPSGSQAKQEEKPAESLHQAAEAGDLAQVKTLIGRGADVNAEDEKGYTALNYAAARGRREVAELLIGAGADINASDANGSTALSSAILRDDLDMVRLLVDKGADVNAHSRDRTPLTWAITALGKKDKEIVELLLNQGANINLEDKKGGYTPLRWAASVGSGPVLEVVLAKVTDPNTIHLAACKGDLTKVKTLIKGGAGVNARDGFGCTALHWAALANTNDVADFLLAEGAEVNAKDNQGASPLLNARRLDMIALLVSKGAEVDIKGSAGYTRLHMACLKREKDIAAFLVSRGANVNTKNNWGWMPLHNAIGNDDREVVELLIANGADVNMGDWMATPLTASINAGHAEITKLLIAKGADVNAKDRSGRTPLGIALDKGQREIADLLRQHGAKEEKSAGQSNAQPAKTLHQAAADGDLEQVRKLIAQGADANATEGERTWTPLLAAATKGHAEIVKFLLESGAKVNAADSYGYTPLYYAIWSDDKETIKALVVGGADVNKRPANRVDYPPLVYAIWQGKKDNVEILLDAGADINTKDDAGNTTLFWAAFFSQRDVLDLILTRGNWPDTIYLAACKGDLERVKTLVENGTDVNAKDEFGCTSLHWASLAYSPAVAEFLLAKGAEIDAKHHRWGLTPLMHAHALPVVELLVSKGADVHAALEPSGRTKLHMACLAGDRDIAEFLIRKGANVNLKTNSGATPLSQAASAGHADVIELLIGKGADVNVPDARGRTPLALARQGKHPEAVRILRQHGAKDSLHDLMAAGDMDEVKRLIAEGAEINGTDGNGQTPLHLAVLAGRKDIVELLIAQGADPNAKANTWDTTPLIAALRNGHENIAKLLIAKGADVTAKGRGDYTPLHRAATNRARMTGATEIMGLLLAKGADIEARQEHGCTPLACATYDGNTDTARFLIEHGADIEAKTNYDETPLMRAVSQGHVETARLLLDKGANIQARRRGLSAVHVAMLGDWLSNRKPDPEMVKLLLEKGLTCPSIHLAAFLGDMAKLKGCLSDGTDINEGDVAGFTPLHCAVAGDHMDTVKFLLSQGANVNAKTANGLTPLAFIWPVDMADLLIANGADVKVADNNGQTMLHWAVNRDNHRGDKALIELLLNHGADVNAKAASTSGGWAGWAPLHVACYNGAQDIVELLLARGADVNARADNGKTPMAVAQSNDKERIVDLLRRRGAKE